MTREGLIKYWNVIEAFKNGETIQVKIDAKSDWQDTSDPLFRAYSEYRIKPKEQWVVSVKTLENRWVSSQIYPSKQEAMQAAKMYAYSEHAQIHQLI